MISARRWVVVVTAPDGTKTTYGLFHQSDAEGFAEDLMGPESDGDTEAEAMMLCSVEGLTRH